MRQKIYKLKVYSIEIIKVAIFPTVARTCKFLWCTVTALPFCRSSVEFDVLSQNKLFLMHIHEFCRFSRILIFRLIHKLLDVIMRCIPKTFHTWLICIKKVTLTSKRSKFSCKFNWKFNLNVLMSIQGVPV